MFLTFVLAGPALAIPPVVAVLPEGIPPIPHGCWDPTRGAPRRPPVPNATALASSVRPVRVWFDPDHPNSAAIAPLVISSIEAAWDAQVDGIGFRAPILPDAADGPDFDVYLIQLAPFSAFVTADPGGDLTPGDGYNGSSTYMVIDHGLPATAVPSYVAHEFNHTSQYTYDFSERSLPIWEGTATVAQYWTLGAGGYWAYDVPSFQEVPNAPALLGDSYSILPATGLGYTYEYGAALWVKWLDEKFGADDGALGLQLWEEASNEGSGLEPDAVDAFVAVTGQSLGESLAGLAVARFLTGDDWDSRGLSDAATWGRAEAVPAEPLSAADLPLDRPPRLPPMRTGQSFLDVDLTIGAAPPGPDVERWIRFGATSASGLESSIAVMWWADDGSSGDEWDAGAAPEVELPAQGLSRVVLAVSNLGPVAWDADDGSPYVDGDQQVQIAFDDRPVATEPGTTPPTDTGTEPGTTPTDTDPPGDTAEPDPDPKDGDEKGCGCASAPAGAGALWPLGLLLLRRRRR